MNLLELSAAVGKSSKEIKEILYNDFNIIILSDDMPLKDNVVEDIMSIFDFSSQNEEIFYQKENKKSLSYTRKLIKYCVNHKYHFFIDTCSLLNQPAFFKFYEILKEYKNILYVPYVVTEELKKIMLDKKREESLKERAETILKFICQESEKCEVIIIGNEKDKRNNEHGEKVIHADRVIIEKLAFYRNDNKNCLFITQDHDVTVDVLKLNEWRSLESDALILVKKIGKGGELEDNSYDIVNPVLPID